MEAKLDDLDEPEEIPIKPLLLQPKNQNSTTIDKLRIKNKVI